MKKKKVVKAKQADVVVVSKGDETLAEVFDLTEKEWDRIANEIRSVEEASQNVHELIDGMKIRGGGSLVLRGYLFGRIVGQYEVENSIKDSLAKFVLGLGGGDEDGD